MSTSCELQLEAFNSLKSRNLRNYMWGILITKQQQVIGNNNYEFFT